MQNMPDFVVDLDDTLALKGTDANIRFDAQLNLPLVNALEPFEYLIATARGMKRSGGMFPPEVQADVEWECTTLARILGLEAQVCIGKPYAEIAYIDDKAMPASIAHLIDGDRDKALKLMAWLNSPEFVQLAEQMLNV